MTNFLSGGLRPEQGRGAAERGGVPSPGSPGRGDHSEWFGGDHPMWIVWTAATNLFSPGMSLQEQKLSRQIPHLEKRKVAGKGYDGGEGGEGGEGEEGGENHTVYSYPQPGTSADADIRSAAGE